MGNGQSSSYLYQVLKTFLYQVLKFKLALPTKWAAISIPPVFRASSPEDRETSGLGTKKFSGLGTNMKHVSLCPRDLLSMEVTTHETFYGKHYQVTRPSMESNTRSRDLYGKQYQVVPGMFNVACRHAARSQDLVHFVPSPEKCTKS